MNPFFWIIICILGFIIAIIAESFNYSSLYQRSSKIMRILIKIITIFVVLLIVIPPFILPFTSQPQLPLSTLLALIIGLPIVILSVVIGLLAFKELSMKTAWTGDSKDIVSSGIYGIVRHPNYLANSLFPIGWAIIFKASYALYVSPLWFMLYLILTIPEERMLINSYGEKYIEYKKTVHWRMIPKII